MKEKVIKEFGVMITIFENGDISLSTKGDVHILKAKQIFDVNDRVKTIIEDENKDWKQFNAKEIKIISKYSQ